MSSRSSSPIPRPSFPSDKPRYLMGIGTPDYILEAVENGIDMFDCVFPTRTARNGLIFTAGGPIAIKKAIYERDFGPLDPTCGCKVCRDHSRAYIRHLYKCEEILYAMLATYHNLYFIRDFVDADTRERSSGRIPRFQAKFLAGYASKGDRFPRPRPDGAAAFALALALPPRPARRYGPRSRLRRPAARPAGAAPRPTPVDTAQLSRRRGGTRSATGSTPRSPTWSRTSRTRRMADYDDDLIGALQRLQQPQAPGDDPRFFARLEWSGAEKAALGILDDRDNQDPDLVYSAVSYLAADQVQGGAAALGGADKGRQ